MSTTNEKNIATFTHLSALTQYFIPFGNYIFPIIIWSAKKNESAFIDQNGRNVLNFQLSTFLYSILIIMIAIPTFIYAIFKNVTITDFQSGKDFVLDNLSAGNLSGLIILGLVLIVLFSILKIVEFILIIYGSVKASNGITYRYPLTINFIK